MLPSVTLIYADLVVTVEAGGSQMRELPGGHSQGQLETILTRVSCTEVKVQRAHTTGKGIPMRDDQSGSQAKPRIYINVDGATLQVRHAHREGCALFVVR